MTTEADIPEAILIMKTEQEGCLSNQSRPVDEFSPIGLERIKGGSNQPLEIVEHSTEIECSRAGAHNDESETVISVKGNTKPEGESFLESTSAIDVASEETRRAPEHDQAPGVPNLVDHEISKDEKIVETIEEKAKTESESLIAGEEISGMTIETTKGDGKEALLHASGLAAENLNEEAEMVTDTFNKDTSMKSVREVQTELIETSLRVEEEVPENSSDSVGEEKDPEANMPREKTEDEKHEKESATCDITEDKSISIIAASSSIQNSNDAISEIGENGKDKLDGPSVSETQPEDIKESPKEEQNEAFQGTSQNDSIARGSGTDDENPEAKLVSSFLKCEEVKERDQSSSENVDSFTLNEEEKTIKPFEKSMEGNYEDKPTHVNDVMEKETSIEKIDADEENQTAEVEFSSRNVGDIHFPHSLVDETTQVQGEDPEKVSKLEPEERVPELIASKEEANHIVNKLEANQSTENTELEQTSIEGAITVELNTRKGENTETLDIEETKEEAKVDSSFLLHEEDMQSKDMDLPMEEVSQNIEFAERDNMENLKHDFMQQNEEVVEKQQIPLDLEDEENETSSRENVNPIEEELNKSLKNRLEGKEEEDRPTDTNEMEKIDTDEKNQTAEAEYSKKNVGDVDVPHSLVDETIQAETENLDSISKFEQGEQVHEGTGTHMEEEKHIGNKLEANQSAENQDQEQTSTEEITMELNTRKCENVETLESKVNLDVKDAQNIKETEEGAKLDSSFMVSEEGMHNQDKDLAVEDVSEIITEKNVDNSKTTEVAKHDNMEDFIQQSEPVKEKIEKSLEMASDQEIKTTTSNANIDSFTFTEEKQSIKTLEESMETTDDEGKPTETNGIPEREISIKKIDANEENQTSDVEISNRSVGDIHVPHSFVDETPQVEGKNPENVSKLEPEEQVHDLNRVSKEEDEHIGNKLEANQRAEDTNLEQTFTEGMAAMQLNTITCENIETLNSKGSLDAKDAEKNIKEIKDKDCSTEITKINTTGDKDEEGIVNEYALAPTEECTRDEKAELSSPAEVEETEREPIGENPENVSKLDLEDQVPELSLASIEEDKHIVSELEVNQSTENTKLEQTSTEGAITMGLNTRKSENMETSDYKGNSCDKAAEKNTEEAKEESKVDSSFLLHEEDMQGKDNDLPVEEVSQITNEMNIDSSETIEFTERNNMENLNQDLVAEEFETSSRENVNTKEEELNKNIKNRLEGKDEEDRPTDTNEMEKIDADEKNQTAEVECSKKNVGDIDVPHSMVDETIQAESENLDGISNSEQGDQVHEGKGTPTDEDKHIGNKLEANQSTENQEQEQTSIEEITMELNTRKCENMETLESKENLDVKDAENIEETEEGAKLDSSFMSSEEGMHESIEETKEDANLDSSFMSSKEGMHNQDKDLAMEDGSEIITEKNADNFNITEAAKHDNMEDFVQQTEPVKEKIKKSLEMASDQENKTTASNENIDSFTFTEEKQSIKTLEESMEATDDEGKATDTNDITEKEISIEKIDADEENQTTDVEISNRSVGDIHVPHSFVDETPQVEGENPENVSKLEPEEQVHELNRASKEEDGHIGNKLEANQGAEDTILEQTFTEGTAAMQLNTITSENIETLNSKGSLDSKDAEKNIKEIKDEEEITKINTTGDKDEEDIVNENAPTLAPRAECTVDEKAELSSPAEVEETERESIGEGKSSKQEEDVENNNKDVQVRPTITEREEVTTEQITEGDIACLSPEPIEEGKKESQGNENKEEEDANEQIITESLVKDRSVDLVQDGQFNDFQDDKEESEKVLEEELETVVEVETIQNEASQNNKNLERTSDTTLVKQEESLQAESVNLAPMQATTQDESNEEKYLVTPLEKQEESTLAAKVNVDPVETEIEAQIDERKSIMVADGDNNNGLAEATETVKIAGANMEEVNAAKEELITDVNGGDISRDVILEDSVNLQDDEKGTKKTEEEESETGAGERISCFTSQDNQSPGTSHSLVKQEESSQVHDVNMNPTEAITENNSQEEKISVEDRDNDVPEEIKETINSENETEKEEDSKEQVLQQGNYEARSPDFVGEPLVYVPHIEKEAEKSKQETFQESENETVDASITDKPSQDNQGPERILDTTLVEAEESLLVDNAIVHAKEEDEKKIPRTVEHMEQSLQEDDQVEKLEGLSNVTSEERKENTSSKSEEKITSAEETIQNPVEASEETTKWEEIKVLEEVTENNTAKEEDIKPVAEELKDSKSTEGKILESDSSNMLETTSAGNETREQKYLDGVKVSSPESTKTETTPDNCKEDENLQSAKLDEKLECTSELVAEDESNLIPETNLVQSDENSNTAQDHNWKFFEEQIIRQQFTEDERETYIEPKSKNRDHVDNVENQKENTRAIVFIDEVEKGDESENSKEKVKEEERKKEGHAVSLDVETVDKVEVGPVSTQYLERQDSEQKEAENSEKEIITLEDPETKEVNTNQEVSDACSKREVQGVQDFPQREPEEKLNADEDKAEAIVSRHILEPRLEDSQLDDKPVEGFTNTVNENVLETTEPGLHGDEVNSVELEDTSPDLASELSVFDHNEAKKECITIEESEANEVNRSQEDSDTRIKSEDNILKETDADETGTTVRTEIPEKFCSEVHVGGEPMEVFVNTSNEKDPETSETSLHGAEVDSMKVGKTGTDLVSQLTNFYTEKEEKKSVTMEDMETSEESNVKETDSKLAVEKLDAVEGDATVKTEAPEMRSRELQLDGKPVEEFLVNSDERPLETTEASPHGDEVDSMKLEEASSHVVSQLSTCDHDKTEEKSIIVEDPEPNAVAGSQAFSDAALMPEGCDVKQAEETKAEKNKTAEKLDADEGDKTVRTVAPIVDKRDEEMYSLVTGEKHDNVLVEAKEETGEKMPRIVEYMEQNLQEDDRVEKLQGLSKITSEETEENTSSKSVEKITSTEDETIQNPVEASEETTKWEETKIPDDFTENETAKEEDIKTVHEVLKDSITPESRNLELDSPNMLETNSAGKETREQKELDGVKVCSPESTETETTPDDCKEDKNLQSTKLDEKLECTSELVAEDESNVIHETNIVQSDKNSNTAQDHNWKFFEEQIIRQQFTEGERETDEDIEPKSENQDHIDNIEIQKEDTHAIVFTDEVHNGEEKDDESENFEEKVTEEENKKEGHVVSLDVEKIDKVEVSGPVSTQYLKRQDSEQKEAENSEKEIITLEDPETKEVNINQGVPVACSKHEIQGVRGPLEREPEEKLNADADKVETIATRQILEPRLVDSHLDDKPAGAFTNTPDEKVLETTEPGLHGDEVDSVQLEETSRDLASELSAFDHDEAKKECMITEDSEANDVNRSQEDSDTCVKSEDHILDETEADETGTTAKTEVPEKICGEVHVGGEPIEVFVNTSHEKDLETSETNLHGDDVDGMKVGKTSTDLASQLTNLDTEKEDKRSVTMEDPETSEESYVKDTDDKVAVEKLDAAEGDATVKTEAPEMRSRELQLDGKPVEEFLVNSDERPLETTEASPHGDEVDSMKLEEASSHVVSQLSTCDHDKTEEKSIIVEDPEPNTVAGSQAFSDAASMPEGCDVKQAEETEAGKDQTAEKLGADKVDKTVKTGATETSMGEAQPSDNPADGSITTLDKRSLEAIEITEAYVHSAEVDSKNPEETSSNSVSQPSVIDNETVKQGSLSVESIDEDNVEESKTSSGVAFESNHQSGEGKNESRKSLAAEKVYVNESSETGSAVAAETTPGEAQSNKEPVKDLRIFSNERSLETSVTTEDRLPGKGDSLKLEETTSTFVSQFPTTDGEKAERVTAEVPGANEVQEIHTFSDVVSVPKDDATTEETSIMGAQLDDKPVKLFTSSPEKSSPEATEMSEANLQGKEIDNIEAVDEDKVEESKLSSDAVFESSNHGGQIDETGKGLPAENLDVDHTSETVTETEASLEDAQLDDKVQKPLTTANDESSLGITGTAEGSLQGEGGDRIKLEETTSNLVSQPPTFGSENADKVEETKISSDAVNELKDHDDEETGKNLIMEKLNPDATSATVTDITKETDLEEAGQSLLDNKHVNTIIGSPGEKSLETTEALQKEVETMQLQNNSSNLSTNAEEDNLGSDAVLEFEVGLKGIEGTGKTLAVDKIDNEIAAGQIPTAEELQEQLQISTPAFPIDEQEHKGTITVKKLEEESTKGVETLEDHSTTMAPEESCLQMEENEKLKPATQETKLDKDLQRNSTSAVCEGEGQPLDGAFQLERQKDEDGVKYVSSPSESEQIIEPTRPSNEASISKSEASEGSSESVTEVSCHEVFMKPEDAEVVEMTCKVTKTDLTEEDHKTFEGSPTTKNEVLSEKEKQVSDKEVAKGEQELNAEEVPANKIDKVPQTVTSDTQNEELTEESESHHTREHTEKRMETEDKIVVDSDMISMKEETGKERFPDEPERKDGVETAIKSNLEDQNGQTNSGNSKVEAALICEGFVTEMPQGTLVNREAKEITPSFDQKEQSSHSRAQKQIPEKPLDETTEATISTRKEDVPPKLNELNAASQELGNVTEVNSEVAGIEHGGQEQIIDLSEKAIEGPTSIDSNKISLSDLLHRSKKESSQVAGHSIEQEESIASQEEMKTQMTETIPVEGPKSDEEDGEEHEKTESGSDAPVILEASRDIDVKAAHKKSHGILSGVGSKVKHSISKVKKVITGKSSHPKTLSPK